MYKKLFLAIVIIGVFASTLMSHTLRHQTRPFPYTWQIQGGTAALTSCCWGETGFYLNAPGQLHISISGADRFGIFTNSFSAISKSNGPSMRWESSTATNPVYTNNDDTDTGVGFAAADQPSIIAGEVEGTRWTEASREIEATTTVCVNGTDNVNTTAVHDLSVNDVVRFTAGTICTGLALNTNYYVESITDLNNFKVALTRGGSAIDITGDGVGLTSNELEITKNTYGDISCSQTTCTFKIAQSCADQGDGTACFTFPQVTSTGTIECVTNTAEASRCRWLVDEAGVVSEPIEEINNCDNANTDDNLNVIDVGTQATLNNRTGATEVVICEMLYD